MMRSSECIYVTNGQLTFDDVREITGLKVKQGLHEHRVITLIMDDRKNQLIRLALTGI